MRQIFCLCICSLLLTSSARAALVVEQFDYGNSFSLLEGTNGGLGFNTPWASTSQGAGTMNYTPSGLSFSSLPTLGGAATTTQSLNQAKATRAFSLPMSTGKIYGSYLIQYQNMGTGGVVGLELLTDTFNNPFSPQSIGLYERYFFNQGLGTFSRGEVGLITSTGGGRGEGAFQAVALNQVYMKIFYADLSPGAINARTWTVSQSQYDSLKQNGVTLDELLSRTNGLGTNQVMDYAAFAFTGVFNTSIVRMNFGDMTNGGTVVLDELRVSQTSFDDALVITAVPEPSSMVFAITVFGVIPVRRMLSNRKQMRLRNTETPVL